MRTEPEPELEVVSPLRAGALGVAGAGLALGAGELVAGSQVRFGSPVEGVAQQVIDRAPRPMQRFAIDTFGHDDKLALVVGTVVISLALGAALGLTARRHPTAGCVGFGLFGAVGVYASTASPTAEALAWVPSVAAATLGALFIWFLTAPASRPKTGEDRWVVVPARALADRRGFLSVMAVTTAAGALAGAGGRALQSRFGAEQSRAGITLPAADRPLPATPTDVEVGVDGVQPFITPNDDFYRVDTALIVPQVRAEDWTLTVDGLVERPFRLTYDELLGRELVEADITMTCVSNPVGGDLVGNARWLGVRTRDLLDEAGVRAGADQLVGRSVDGYTCGFPISAVYDRNCLVAVGMNGEPLPLDHGFPVRLLTPGIYGYVGSTKWLTELEVATFADFDQYWVRRGYADRAPVKPMARIDTPRSGQRLTPGPVPVAGVAWAQADHGIDGVEVRVDDGDFQPAELAAGLGADTWRQWRFDWDAAPGRHTVVVRAIDGTGQTQTDERADVFPDGASGWMSLVLLVDDP